jgi:D-amino-acid dehydrogenase
MSKQVDVIGAGITGLMSAYFLSKKGYQVSVFEREPYPAMQCSYANGGQISVCNSETWNNWPTVWKGTKWLFKKDAPLLIRPYPSYHKIKWMAGFLKHTITGKYIHNTIDTIRLGMESRELYNQIDSKYNLGPLYDRVDKGMMHIHTNEKDYQHAASMQELFRAYGLEWDMISVEEAKRIEPALKSFKDVLGGTYVKSDWSGDIHKYCRLIKNVLKDRGVLFYFGSSFDMDRIDRPTVIATGHEMYNHARELGDDFNIYPVKGYSITINLNDERSRQAAPTVSLLDNNKKIVASRMGDRLRVAGTAELDGANLDIRQERIEPLLQWVRDNFKDVSADDYSSWACLRPMSSNMMPIVQKSKSNDNVFYNGGHGHLGWTLGAVTGKMVADLI